MAEQRKSGCGTAALVVAILLALLGAGAVGMIVLFRAKAMESHSMSIERSFALPNANEFDHANRVSFQSDEMPRYEGFEKGQELTREVFLAYTLDRDATKLAQQNFLAMAEGSKVNWLIKTVELETEEGGIVGEFLLPYQVVEGRRGSRSGSSVTIHSEFPRSASTSLAKVRKGDWIMVTGTLSLKDGNFRILNPTLTNTGEGANYSN